MQDQTESAKVPRVLTLACVWLVLTVAAVALQWRAGAYESGFGGHPDEGAHFVTGLMVRDYLVDGLPRHPMRYAENYYAHYPKVALGHYPPALYVLEGVWLCVFPVSRVSPLLLMAGLCGWLGTAVFATAWPRVGPLPAALAAAALAVALPLTQAVTSSVMADLLVAILMFLSARSFARYLERERWRDSLWFGLWAAAAAMTKGSALCLALLPPAAIVLTGRYRLLGRGSLWVAVLPVLLVCGPWFWLSVGITAEGMNEGGLAGHVRAALPYFPRQLVRAFGFALLLPAAIGAGRVLLRKSPEREPFWVVMLALPLCLVIFLCAVPAGLEARYLLPTVPSVLLFALAGAGWLVERCASRRRSAAAWACGLAVLGLFCVETFTVPRKDFRDDRPRALALADLAGSRGEPMKLLVSSDARGEGAFISEVAILDERRPSHTVERSSKVLSTSDWLGRGYRETFESDERLRAFLLDQGYHGIIVDEAIPEVFLRPDHARLARVLAASGEFVRLPDPSGAAAAPGRRGGNNAVYVRAASGS